MKRKIYLPKLVVSLLFVGAFFISMAHGAFAEKLEVAEVRSLGNMVKVPVTLYEFSYLQNLTFEVNVGLEAQGIELVGFEPISIFKESDFRTLSTIVNNRLKIDILSYSGKEVRITDKRLLVGYITYRLPSSFQEGTGVNLPIGKVVANGRAGADMLVETLDGKIERRIPFGDVNGTNEPSASSAMRILQHVNGDHITGKEQLLAADVDGDNVITQLDAQQILNYVTGKRTSFLAIRSKELDPAVMKSEYQEQITAIHGRAPYTYGKVGTLPSGIKLDAETGMLSGTPTGTRESEYKFTIKVTDATGNTADRQFVIPLIDSNVIATEKLLPINVKQNEQPILPSEVNVTYRDKTTGIEKVVWEAVDTSTIGMVTAKGKTNSGFTVIVQINVVDTQYLQDIQIHYMNLFNLHTIKVTASAEVYSATVNDISMHFEGNNLFSLGTTDLKHNSNVTIVLLDKFGNILEQKQITLN